MSRRGRGVSLSTRRPGQRPAAEDMEVKMKNFLAGITARIEDDPVAALTDPFFPGDLPGPEKDLPEQGFRSVGGVVEGGEVVLGDDQDVDRRLGPDVLEDEDALVLEEDLGRDLLADDAAEKAVARGW